MEGRGVLLHGEMHEAKIVEDLPIKGSQVISTLQTTDGLKSINNQC